MEELDRKIFMATMYGVVLICVVVALFISKQYTAGMVLLGFDTLLGASILYARSKQDTLGV